MLLTSTLPQLGDSGPYFLSHAQRLAAADYRPSDEDILRARSVTHGIVVVPFQVDTDTFFRCRTSFYSANMSAFCHYHCSALHNVSHQCK